MNGIQLISSSKINMTLHADDQAPLADSEKESNYGTHLNATCNSLPQKLNKYECAMILCKEDRLYWTIAQVIRVKYLIQLISGHRTDSIWKKN
jgi:hypothetical protein